MQEPHALPPLLLLNLPNLHPVQLRLQLPHEYVPALQRLHTLSIMAVQADVWYLPAVHTVQE